MVSLTRPTLPETRVSLGAVWVALLTLGTGLAQTPAQPQYTIRARVPLTIVDVIVTDSKGKPVHGLRQSDFTILEDNQPMTPNSFEGHSAAGSLRRSLQQRRHSANPLERAEDTRRSFHNGYQRELLARTTVSGETTNCKIYDEVHNGMRS